MKRSLWVGLAVVAIIVAAVILGFGIKTQKSSDSASNQPGATATTSAGTTASAAATGSSTNAPATSAGSSASGEFEQRGSHDRGQRRIGLGRCHRNDRREWRIGRWLGGNDRQLVDHGSVREFSADDGGGDERNWPECRGDRERGCRPSRCRAGRDGLHIGSNNQQRDDQHCVGWRCLRRLQRLRFEQCRRVDSDSGNDDSARIERTGSERDGERPAVRRIILGRELGPAIRVKRGCGANRDAAGGRPAIDR